MSGVNESVLLRRLLRNDPAAWREIVENYSGLLLAVSRRTLVSCGFVPSPQDCEDAVAEVWHDLLENDRQVVRRCLKRGHFLPTLQVLARNRSIDLLRRRKLVVVALDEDALPAAPVPEGPPFSPDLIRQLPAALESLSARERTLVELFFLQEKKYREIALLTGVPQNSIGPTLARSLVKLREKLAAAGGDNG